MKEKTVTFVQKIKDKGILIFVGIVLIVGVLIGYNISGKSLIEEKYNSAITENTDLKSELDVTKSEYSAYKEKMQPYEAQQAADAKAKSDKEIADKKAAIEAEQAKKDAEEKAAEEKAAADAEAAKSKTFGISANDFYTSFNNIASSSNCDALLIKQNGTGNYFNYTTMNSDVRLSCTLAYNFLSAITIDIKRNASADSLSDSAYYVVCSALAVDPSNTADDISSLLTSLLNEGSANIGTDCKRTRNGIDYIVNVSNSSILYQIQKTR